MPRICRITGCKKTAKLVCDTITPTLYICGTVDEQHTERKDGLFFKKIVNSPCITCVSTNVDVIKEATFGPTTDGKLKRIYCKTHSMDATNSDTPISHKKETLRVCEQSGCSIQPSFCLPGETLRRFCKMHKPTVAITRSIAIGTTCTFEFEDRTRCIVQPVYGFPDDKRPTLCRSHRLQGMVNVVDLNRGCSYEGCTVTRASFGFIGDKKPSRCAQHREGRMVDIINKKCKGCGLFVVTARKNHLCFYCSNGTKQQRCNEPIVASILAEVYPEHQFIHNRTFQGDTSCALKKYRPDFILDQGFYHMIVECDEDAHRQYDASCERKRMYEITSGLGTPVVFVRYNPHSFITGPERILNPPPHGSIKKHHLTRTINKYLKTITPETMEQMFNRSTILVHYLFYDNAEASHERVVGLVEDRNGVMEEILL